MVNLSVKQNVNEVKSMDEEKKVPRQTDASAGDEPVSAQDESDRIIRPPEGPAPDQKTEIPKAPPEPEPQPARNASKLINRILIGLLILACVLCLVGLLLFGILPAGLTITITIILVLICVLLAVLFLRLGAKKTWRIALRVITCLLLCLMVGIDYTLFHSYSVLTSMTSQRTSTIQTSVLTLADSKIQLDKELAGKKVGYSMLGDASSITNAMSEINQSAENVEYVQQDDYLDLYEQLKAGKIEAMIIPNTRIALLRDTDKKLDTKTRTIATYKVTRQVSAAVPNIDISKEPFVVYLAGLDEGDDPSEDGRADVNILVMVDPVHNHMITVSVPRDSYVPNPAYKNGSDKLTHLGNDGPENSMGGLEETFGIDIDYYAKVNFQSLIHIVDAIGGVEVDVKLTFDEQDEYRNKNKENRIYLKKGLQTLNGKQALAYARHRKTAGYETTGRENAQQDVIRAIMKKLTTADGMARINNLMDVARDYVYTNIPFSSIQSFVNKQLAEPKAWSTESITLRTGEDATLTTVSMPSMPLSCYLLSQTDIDKVYNAYMGLHESPVLKDFTFDLSDNPECEIDYPDERPEDKYVITTADAALLNPYTVYYGIDNSDDASASSAQQRAEEFQTEIIVPEYYPTFEQPPVQQYPTYQEPGYGYEPGYNPGYVPDYGGSSGGSSSGGSSSGGSSSGGSSSGGSSSGGSSTETPGGVIDVPSVDNSQTGGSSGDSGASSSPISDANPPASTEGQSAAEPTVTPTASGGGSEGASGSNES